MEHAAHVWYHDKVDALEKKGWERSAVFMRRLVIDAQAVVLYMAVCVLIFVIDLFTQGTAERLASPPYRCVRIRSRSAPSTGCPGTHSSERKRACTPNAVDASS